MEKTTVYFDESDYRRLKRVAARRRLAPAAVVRQAIAEYVARHDTPRGAKSVGAFASRRKDLSERAEDLLEGFGRSR